MPSPQDVSFILYNNLGEELLRINRFNFTVGSEIFDIHSLSTAYYVKAITSSNEFFDKFIIVVIFLKSILVIFICSVQNKKASERMLFYKLIII